MNGYEAIAKILKQEGVEWIACYPAHPLIEAVAKEGIRPIMFRQERGGINAADGYSRQMSGKKFGVFMCQGGPGAENAMGGFAQAYADSVPVLFLPDGAALDRLSVKPTFWASQTYKPVTKSAESVTKPDLIVPMMRRAFQALRQGRGAPALVELHRDGVAGDVTNLDSYRPPKAIRSAPSRTDIQDTVKQLLNAKRPVIWAGQGVLYANATEELRELAELTQIPVITTMPGKSAISEDHPLSLGAANRTAPLGVWTWLKESDVFFAVGSSLTITNYGITVPPGKFMIHSTNNPEDISKDYSIDIPLAGDAKLVLQAMIEEVKAQAGDKGRSADTAIQEDVAEVKKRWLDEWAPLLNSDMNPANPYRLVNEINKAVDHQNTIMTHDAGHPRDQIMPFYKATVPHSYIGWGKSTHLGYGIGLAIGSKMAQPDKFCVNFMGDGAFGMAGLDIETSVRSDNPITTILLNNGTMGGYNRSLPTAMEKYGAGNMSGDYAKIAEGLGAVGIKVETPGEIGAAIKKARQLNDDGRSVLLDVKTQPELKFSVYDK